MDGCKIEIGELRKYEKQLKAPAYPMQCASRIVQVEKKYTTGSML